MNDIVKQINLNEILIIDQIKMLPGTINLTVMAPIIKDFFVFLILEIRDNSDHYT